MNNPEEWIDKYQSTDHRQLFWSNFYGSAGRENGSKAFSFDQLFKYVDEPSKLDLSDGERKALGRKHIRYSSRACQLNSGIVDDWSAQSDVYGAAPNGRPSSTRRPWWNPVAVLSDLRPNIRYHQGAASDTSSEDEGPNRKRLPCRRGGFVVITADVDGRRFQGRGRTTKQAKRRLAAEVLRTLFNFRFIGQKPHSSQR